MGNLSEQPPQYDLEKARAEATEMEKMIAEGEAENYKDADNKIEKEKEECIKKAQERYDKAREQVAKNPNESISHQLSSYFGIQNGYNLYPGIPETYEIAEKIVDESVQVEVERERINNLNYIIKGVLEYNLDKINKDSSSEYTFKPKSLEQEALIKRKGEDLDEDLAEFCKSKNPIEYIKYVIENEREFPKNLEPEKIVELIDLARGHIGEEKLNDYTKKYMNGEIAENLIEKSMQAKNLKSFAEGIYVDVDGTLIQKNGLNQPLMDYLISTSNNVTIFTNGDLEGKTKELRDLGVPEKFLPVKSKEQYRGILLEKVFDDQTLNYQGFEGLIHVNPNKKLLGVKVFANFEIPGTSYANSKEDIDKAGKQIIEEYISREQLKGADRFVVKKKAQLRILKELNELKSNK